MSFAIYTRQGSPLTQLLSDVTKTEGFPVDLPPSGQFECVIPRIPLNLGSYTFNLMASSGPDWEAEDLVLGAGSFSIEHSDFYEKGGLTTPKFPSLTDHTWRHCAE
jgi:hypothetical protein